MKKAFIIGANGKNLNYAISDSVSFAQRLVEHNYLIAQGKSITEIENSITLKHSRDKIKSEFEAFCKNCEDSDSLILYFSGHGFVENKELFLVLNSSDTTDLSSCLAISDIIYPLKNFCKAKHQLIILDACRSGAISNDYKFNTTEDFQIITATGSSGTAQEDEKLKAGVMTYFINQALDGIDNLASDRFGNITPGSLHTWLNRKIDDYNSNPGNKKVSKINLIGETQNVFEIVTLKDSPAPRTKDIIIELYKQSDKIKELSDINITNEVLKKSYTRKLEYLKSEIQKIESYINADIKDRNLAVSTADKLKFEERIELREKDIFELATRIDEISNLLNNL